MGLSRTPCICTFTKSAQAQTEGQRGGGRDVDDIASCSIEGIMVSQRLHSRRSCHCPTSLSSTLRPVRIYRARPFHRTFRSLALQLRPDSTQESAEALKRRCVMPFDHDGRRRSIPIRSYTHPCLPPPSPLKTSSYEPPRSTQALPSLTQSAFPMNFLF